MKILSSKLVVLTLLAAATICFAQNEEDDEDDEEEEEDGNKTPPHGHLQPVGNSGFSWNVEETTTIPDPITFYEKYVIPSKAVVFKGLAKTFPSYENFRSDEYLKKNYGKWKILYERTKKENRNDEREGLRASFKKFLNIYKKENIYMVTEVFKPNPITNDIYVPKPMLCDDFTKRIERCNIWISSGGTKSVLHIDTLENMHCVFDGTKEFVMVHINQKENLGLLEDGHAPIDVEKVDLIKHPEYARISWYKAKVQAGDCLYLPYEWAHHVNATGTRNIAVNLWWSATKSIPNLEQCKKQIESIKPVEPFTNFDINIRETTKTETVHQIQQVEKEPLTVDRFHDQMFATHGRNFYTDISETNKMFKQIDTDGDGLIWFRDLYNADPSIFGEMIDIINKENYNNDKNRVTKYEEVHEKDEL